MSKSLSIEIDWIHPPDCADPVEQRTWACVRVHAGGRAVTRVWDRGVNAERVSLFLPAFPLARWMVENWWPLLHEPSPREELTAWASATTPHQRDWIRRHCMRAAEPGLLLPRAYLFSDGERVRIRWFADEASTFPHMPAHFLEEGSIALTRSQVEDAFTEFLNQVEERLDECDDVDARAWIEDWEAIKAVAVDVEESTFCSAAGRLGLNPHRTEEWPPELAAWIEDEIGDELEDSIAMDLFECMKIHTSSDVDRLARYWRWTRDARRDEQLEGPPTTTPPAGATESSPAREGYRLAREARRRLGPGRLDEIQRVDARHGNPSWTTITRSDFPGAELRGLVGWRGGSPLLIAPKLATDDSRRFLEARALFLSAHAGRTGERLITKSHTYDQQASRAFAAELLAPQEELADAVAGADWIEHDAPVIRELARAYGVSTRVIEYQFQNSGIEVAVD